MLGYPETKPIVVGLSRIACRDISGNLPELNLCLLQQRQCIAHMRKASWSVGTVLSIRINSVGCLVIDVILGGDLSLTDMSSRTKDVLIVPRRELALDKVRSLLISRAPVIPTCFGLHVVQGRYHHDSAPFLNWAQAKYKKSCVFTAFP